MGNTPHVRLVPRSEISAGVPVRLDSVRVLEQRCVVLSVLDHGDLFESQPAVIPSALR
jgi:hypothetical protein